MPIISPLHSCKSVARELWVCVRKWSNIRPTSHAFSRWQLMSIMQKPTMFMKKCLKLADHCKTSKQQVNFTLLGSFQLTVVPVNYSSGLKARPEGSSELQYWKRYWMEYWNSVFVLLLISVPSIQYLFQYLVWYLKRYWVSRLIFPGQKPTEMKVIFQYWNSVVSFTGTSGWQLSSFP